MAAGARVVIGAVIALALQVGAPTLTAVAATLPSDAAVAFQIDATHSGSQSDPISPTSLQRQWTIDLGAPVNYSVIAGGRLFVTAGPLLYAFDLQTGTQIWGPIDTGGRYAFATYDGGRLFVHNATNFLRALDPATGKTLWLDRLPGEVTSNTPPVALNGTIYAVGIASGGILYAVDETDGSIKWVQDGSPGSYFVIIGGHSSPVATGTGIYLGSSCGWNYDFRPADGNTIWQTSGACTTGGGLTSALYNGRFYARDFSSTVYSTPDQVLDATTGATVGSFLTSQAPAFAGSTGFFVVAGKLEARDVSTGNPRGANPLWTFTGDGSLTTAPVVANGYGYIGSSKNHLYAVRADTGAQAWTDTTPSPMQGESGSSWLEPALAIGQGMLAVPAGNTLTVYGNATPPGPPGPRPIPTQGFPPPPSPGSSGTQSSFQVDAVHSGFQSGDTTTPPLAYAWARNFASTPSTPLIAGGRAFVTANDPSGANAMSLYALNLRTGAVDWGPVALGPSNSAAGLAYDNGKLFVLIGANMTGTLNAYDATTGQQLWTTALTQTMQYGFGIPPVALNGSVYVTGNGHNGTMFAVSQVDGHLLWTTFVEDAALPAVTSTGIYVDTACWAMDINPQTGARTWENRSICTGAGGGVPAVFGNQVYLPDQQIGNSVVNPQGSVLGTFSADRTPAFFGSLGFFPIGSRIMAEDLASNTVDWTFDGDGSLVAGPVIVNGYVYIGSSAGNLYALRASDGAVAWSDNVKSPIAASMLNGLGAGGNTLLVPATNRLVAYVPCASATCASAPQPPPVVTGIDPKSGFEAGGDTLFIRGSGFTGATGVSFGGTPASSFTVVSSDAINAIIPPGSGTVDVTVTSAAGISLISNVDRFTYIPPPAVTGVTPNQGSMAGGTRVTISGTKLGAAVYVWFGTSLASNVVGVSDTQILATSPPGGGTVDITVKGTNGTSVKTAADLFTYLAPPAVPTAPAINPRGDADPPPPTSCLCGHRAMTSTTSSSTALLNSSGTSTGEAPSPLVGEGRGGGFLLSGMDAFFRALLRFW